VAAAKKVAAAGRLTVGWVSARVKVLTPRPLRCYRCLELEHTRSRCTAPIERGDRCYRCGVADHKAGSCAGEVRRPLCSDLGRPAGHRLGAKSCAPQMRQGARKTGRTSKFAPLPAPTKTLPARPSSQASTADMEVGEGPGPELLAHLTQPMDKADKKKVAGGVETQQGITPTPPAISDGAGEGAMDVGQ